MSFSRVKHYAKMAFCPSYRKEYSEAMDTIMNPRADSMQDFHDAYAFLEQHNNSDSVRSQASESLKDLANSQFESQMDRLIDEGVASILEGGDLVKPLKYVSRLAGEVQRKYLSGSEPGSLDVSDLTERAALTIHNKVYPLLEDRSIYEPSQGPDLCGPMEHFGRVKRFTDVFDRYLRSVKGFDTGSAAYELHKDQFHLLGSLFPEDFERRDLAKCRLKELAFSVDTGKPVDDLGGSISDIFGAYAYLYCSARCLDKYGLPTAELVKGIPSKDLARKIVSAAAAVNGVELVQSRTA